MPPASFLKTPGSGRERAVLVVDDEPKVSEVLIRMLAPQGFVCHSEDNAESALARLRSGDFAVLLSDLRMPGRDGMWLLEKVRQECPETAVIILTGDAEVDVAVQCVRDGASDFLTKPIRLAHLLTAVERALERRRLLRENRLYQQTLEARVREATRELRQANVEIVETYQMTLLALSSALDAREEETADHSRRVMDLALKLAEQLQLDRAQRDHIARAALLHDIGKIGVPDHVLLKPSRLEADEWEIMRRHPEIGYRILKNIPFLQPAAEIVLSHHEHFDGSGYPRGLTGEAIPLGARVFAVADTIDAITSDRPYRRADSIEAAMREVERCSSRQFDPEVVEALFAVGIQSLTAMKAGTIGTAALAVENGRRTSLGAHRKDPGNESAVFPVGPAPAPVE